MKTIEEVKHFFEVDLKKDLDQFEAGRIASSKTPLIAYRRNLKILGFISIVHITAAFVTLEKMVQYTAGIPVLITVVYAISRIMGISGNAHKKYKSLVWRCTEFVIPKLLTFMDSKLLLDFGLGFDKRDIQDSLLFPDAPMNNFKSHSLVSYPINNFNVNIAFINDTYHDEGSVGDNFRGLFSRTEMFSDYPENIIIRPNVKLQTVRPLLGKAVGGLLDKLNTAVHFSGVTNLVTTGDSGFDYHFEVYSSDQEGTKALLNKELREQLILMAVQTKNWSHFAFVRKYFYTYALDPTLFKYTDVNIPLNSFELFQSYCQALLATINVVSAVNSKGS